MDNLKTFFNQAAAYIAARLPEPLAQSITLGSETISDWYDHNGYFKFEVGAKIDCKGPNYAGYGLDPQGWTVTGHGKDKFGGDAYTIETAAGETQTHFKWNIENQFKIANPNATPFDPKRFQPKA